MRFFYFFFYYLWQRALCDYRAVPRRDSDRLPRRVLILTKLKTRLACRKRRSNTLKNTLLQLNFCFLFFSYEEFGACADPSHAAPKAQTSRTRGGRGTAKPLPFTKRTLIFHRSGLSLCERKSFISRRKQNFQKCGASYRGFRGTYFPSLWCTGSRRVY